MCNKKQIEIQALVSKLVHYCLGLALKFLWSVMNGSKAHLYAMSPSDGEHSTAFRNLSFYLHHNNMKLNTVFFINLLGW